jgi:hypothetical protein
MSLNEFAIRNLAQQYGQYQDRDRLRGEPTPTVHLGHKTEYILQWHIGSGITMSHVLTDNDFKLRSTPTPAGKLPDEYQKLLASEIAALQKQGGAFRGQTTVSPPPPR